MPFFKFRCGKIKRSSGRGVDDGEDMAPVDALKEMFVVGYSETKGDFDKLD